MNSISADALSPGDIVLFRGTHPLSRAIRLVDDAEYDHIAVVTRTPDHESGIWMSDVGFTGLRTFALTDYEDKIARILIRRHRIPTWREPLLSSIANLADAGGARYDWERLLNTIVISFARFSTQLTQIADPSEILRWHENLNTLWLAVAGQRAETPSKPAKVCADLVADGVDTFIPNAPADSYLGLVFPPAEMAGLAQWLVSGETFIKFLDTGTTRVRYRVDTDIGNFEQPERIMSELFQAHSFPRPPGNETRSVPELETRLRSVLLESIGSVLRVLGAPAPATSTPELMAWYLLDQVLLHRVIVTPRDLHRTPSLYDVGHLDLASANAPIGDEANG